jgi:two-component system, LytTR family, response regulator
VQIIGGTSFDLVPAVRAGAAIVFVTAHDLFAVRAFEVNALDYLLKPVAPARLAATMLRVAAELAKAPDSPVAKEPVPLGGKLRYDDVIFLRTGLRALFVSLENISLITAQDNYCEVTLADGTRAFMRKSLQVWEDTLPPTYVMRVHRTQIVNLTQVVRYERDTDERTSLFLSCQVEPVSASRHRWRELRERLAVLRPAP